jgi:hypothetical protein
VKNPPFRFGADEPLFEDDGQHVDLAACAAGVFGDDDEPAGEPRPVKCWRCDAVRPAGEEPCPLCLAELPF